MALTRLQGQVDEDRHPRGDLTVRQAVAQWLEVADLADTTRERYEYLVRCNPASTRRPAGGQARRPGSRPPVRPAPAVP
jgi:hypothetical protein